MPYMYEALVGHLYLVNGRALSAMPPGARVEVAPPRAARGREADTVFVLVLPHGEPATTAFYQRMASHAAERYFSSAGGVTAGLRTVCDELNTELLMHNRSVTSPRAFYASVVLAVLHDDDLYLCRVGQGAALLWHDGALARFPTPAADNDDADPHGFVFGEPLGVQEAPDVRMKLFKVGAGARLALADAEVNHATSAALEAAMRAEDLPAALGAFKAALVDRGAVLVAALLAYGAGAAQATREGTSTDAALAAPATSSVGAGGAATLMTPPDVGTRVLDAALTLRDRTQTALGGAALGASHGVVVANRALEHYFAPKDNAPRQWWQTAGAAGAALIVPLVVVALVLVFWVTGIDRSAYERCVQDAEAAANIARAVDSADVNGLLATWNQALSSAASCQAIAANPTVTDPTLAQIRREGQAVIDRLLNVDRRATTPVATFMNAQLTRVVLRGLNMYVLDAANGLVYEVQLANDGLSVRPGTQQPIRNMWKNAPVNQYTLSDIVDITWSEDGTGLSQANVLLALDRNGVLVEHSPTILTRGAQQLRGVETWVNPVALRVWRGRLYLLDPGANQIWRYDPTGGSYSQGPQEYFTGQPRPNIRDAVDFSITPDGLVYVLLRNGQMGVYRGGEALSFGFANFPAGQELVSADALFMSDSPILPGLYIASRYNKTIYEVTQAGTFTSSFRPADEDVFATLSNVAADPSQRLLYALSGNSIFAFRRDPS